MAATRSTKTRKTTKKPKKSKSKFAPKGLFGSSRNKLLMIVFGVVFGLSGLYFLYGTYAAADTDTIVIKNRTVRLGDDIRVIKDLVDDQAAPLYQYPKIGNAEVFINTNKNKITSIIITGDDPTIYLKSINIRKGDTGQEIKKNVPTVTDKGKYRDLIKRKGLLREKGGSIAYALEDECSNNRITDTIAVVLKEDKYIKEVADMIAFEPALCGEVVE